MSESLTDEIFASMQARSTAYQSAFDQGVLIGRREMKPLIREICGYLEDCMGILAGNAERRGRNLIARAQEALEND